MFIVLPGRESMATLAVGGFLGIYLNAALQERGSDVALLGRRPDVNWASRKYLWRELEYVP